jgi:hypothetical protein
MILYNPIADCDEVLVSWIRTVLRARQAPAPAPASPAGGGGGFGGFGGGDGGGGGGGFGGGGAQHLTVPEITIDPAVKMASPEPGSSVMHM